MINTENNESLIEISEKKEFIQKIYSKIENLENEVEFGESLTSAVLKSAKSSYYYSNFVKLTNEELNPKPYHPNIDNVSISKLKLPFFKEVVIKSYEMDNDSRDLFWSIIYTIIKLSNTMHNTNDFEANQLYRNWEGFKAEIGSFGEFSVEWISNQIKILYPEIEMKEVFADFNSDYNNTINYLVKNIVKRTETELPFQEPCLVTVLSNLLDCVCIFLNLNLDDMEFSNINPGLEKSIKFDFSEIVAPSLCDIQDNGCEPYKVTGRKIFIGKFFQLVLQYLCLDGCETGSEDWKLLNKYKKRFFLDKYLIEFLKSKVEEYSKKYLL